MESENLNKEVVELPNTIPVKSAEEWIKQYESSIKRGTSDIKVAIGLPMLFPFIHFKFFNSFMMLKKPTNHLTISLPGSLTSLARNSIVDLAIENNCTHIMFLDTDMTFPANTIEKLINHDKDIVGGLYFERYHPYKPAVFWKDTDGDYALKDIPQNKLVECDAIGTGCLLIKTSVFEKLEKPYFEYRLGKYGTFNDNKFFSEDIVFCETCKSKGMTIYCDTSIKCGHLLTDVEVTEEFWNNSKKSLDQETA